MSKTYMQRQDKDGKASGEIICVALSDWARYRGDGYAFVETDEDGQTAAQQFVSQEKGKVPDRSENAEVGDRRREPGTGTEPPDDDEDEGVSMSNSKDEIVAYLVANDIDHDASDTKAELLDLIE